MFPWNVSSKFCAMEVTLRPWARNWLVQIARQGPPHCHGKPTMISQLHPKHPQISVRYSQQAHGKGAEMQAAQLGLSFNPIVAHNSQWPVGRHVLDHIFQRRGNLMLPLESIFTDDKLWLDGAMASDHSFMVKNHFENFTCLKIPPLFIYFPHAHFLTAALITRFFKTVNTFRKWLNHDQLSSAGPLFTKEEM